jgi:hypothetical protein
VSGPYAARQRDAMDRVVRQDTSYSVVGWCELRWVIIYGVYLALMMREQDVVNVELDKL